MNFRQATTFLVALALLAGGCATKSDVDRLESEIALLKASQDSLLRAIGSLETELEEAESAAVGRRGDTQRQLNDMERQLVQIQELLGQSHSVLQSLRGQAESRPLANETAGQPSAGGLAPSGRGGVGEPTVSGDRGDEPAAAYNAAIEQLRRGAVTTARTGFQEFLVAFPADELAPDAQYYLAETYREEGDRERALREYGRVVELYPNSQAAPTALYKAGLLQEEQGNKDFACEYFQRVLAGYPRSEAAQLAREQAGRLSCR